MECIIHAGTRLGTALGALAKRERRYSPDDAISFCMYRKAEALKQPIPSHNDYRGIKCLNPNDVEKMISIYERIANESLLRRVTHAARHKTKMSPYIQSFGHAGHKLQSIRKNWSS